MRLKVGDYVIIDPSGKGWQRKYAGWVGHISSVRMDEYCIRWIPMPNISCWGDDSWFRLATASEVMTAKLLGGICPLD